MMTEFLFLGELSLFLEWGAKVVPEGYSLNEITYSVCCQRKKEKKD